MKALQLAHLGSQEALKVGFIAALLTGLPARPAVADSLEACQPQAFRWADDCRFLAGLPSPRWLDGARYLPLTTDATLWVSLGGEAHVEDESLDAMRFGIGGSPAYNALGERFLLSADLHAANGPRMFLQLNTSFEWGRKPVERPFDRSRTDLAQGFVDLPWSLGNGQFYLRLGRQEYDSGGNRLVSVRNATNIRRAFDMELLHADFGQYSAESFYSRPVNNHPHSFDDTSNSSERFWGARLIDHGWIHGGTAELFYYGLDRHSAVFQDGSGRELRGTAGLRLSGEFGRLWFLLQPVYQWGSLKANHLRAEALSLEIKYRIAEFSWKPQLGLLWSYTSGDRRSGDRRITTFESLYPNLGYFTDAPLYYPGNHIEIDPSVAVVPLSNTQLKVGVDVLFRATTHDSIYQPPGVPLVRGDGTGSHFGAALPYISASWKLDANIELYSTYVRANPGAAIRKVGGRDADYVMTQLTLRF